MQKTALSGPRFAYDGEHFPLPHLEGQVFKEHQICLTRLVNLLKSIHAKDFGLQVSLIYWMHWPALTVQTSISTCIFIAFSSRETLA